MFNIKNIHIEVSSKCTLKCPRCPRTEIKPDDNNKDIRLETFKNAFDVDVLNQIDRILFCGHIGDPIYARDFLDICQYIKDNSKTIINIVTNGSYKSTDWWTELGLILDNNDMVTFSVDGWDDKSNQMYRFGSNFDSIINGVKTLVSINKCRVNWSSIYFSFNENNFNTIQQLAKELGVDTFRSVKSSKFDWRYWNDEGVDLLKPSESFVSKTYAYENTIETFKRPVIVKNYSIKAHSWAKCLNFEKEIFINVDGYVSPCPWFRSDYQDNDFLNKHQHKLSIFNRSLTEILNDECWNELLLSFNENPLPICKIKCKNNQ